MAALLKLGMTNKQIANKLGMSMGCVKVHVAEVLRRLGVSNRTQAAIVLLGGDVA